MNRTPVLALAAVILAGTLILVGIHTAAHDKGAAQAAAARLAADRLATARPGRPTPWRRSFPAAAARPTSS